MQRDGSFHRVAIARRGCHTLVLSRVRAVRRLDEVAVPWLLARLGRRIAVDLARGAASEHGYGFEAGVLPLLTVREASRALKVHENTLYELVRRREIPHLRVGRQIRFPAGALAAWVERQAVASLQPRTEET